MRRATIRLVNTGWDRELSAAIRADSSKVRIVSHFIKERSLDRLQKHRPCDIQVITRFNLADFADSTSDAGVLN